MVKMIIKGLFRRYERWNPVHPTSGAFWGMGLGVGCGVGWGPGFGPEVVGYVGAGCGVGFSVGFTLAGVGIGLPANFLYQVPYNAAVATTNLALGFARSNGVLSTKDATGNVWINVTPDIWSLQREASEKLSFIKQNHLFAEGIDFFDMRKRLPGLTASIREGLRTVQGHLIGAHKGSQD